MGYPRMATGAALALTVFGSALGTTAASAADVTMNVGWETPLESDYGVFAGKFEELVEQYSDSTIDVKLRCCGQIASEDNAFRALQLGTVDAYIISQNNVSPHWPLMDVLVLPYTFEDTDHLRAVADGPAALAAACLGRSRPAPPRAGRRTRTARHRPPARPRR